MGNRLPHDDGAREGSTRLMSESDSKITRTLSEAEIKCEKCSSTKFELMRTTSEQVALFCVECQSSSLLNADDLDGIPVLTFWTEKDL